MNYNWQYENPAGSGNYTNIFTGSGTGTPPFTTSQNASPSLTRNYRLTVSNSLGCTASGTQLVTVVADPTITINGTDVSCNGGSDAAATATISGGIPGISYNYNWFPGSPTGDGTLSISNLSTSKLIAIALLCCVLRCFALH